MKATGNSGWAAYLLAAEERICRKVAMCWISQTSSARLRAGMGLVGFNMAGTIGASQSFTRENGEESDFVGKSPPWSGEYLPWLVKGEIVAMRGKVISIMHPFLAKDARQ